MRSPDMDLFAVPQELTAGSVTSGLPPTLRQEFETSFGRDLSEVRIHEGTAAILYGASAFSEGNNIHFAPGTYQPHSDEGRKLLSHELTHVVQQTGAAGAEL